MWIRTFEQVIQDKTFSILNKLYFALNKTNFFISFETFLFFIFIFTFFTIRPPPELLPVLGPLGGWRDAYTWRGPAVWL